MTEELLDLQGMARAFFAKELVPHEARWASQQHVDREFWLKAGAVGLLCPSIPASYGGGGGSFAHEAVIYSEANRALDSAFGNTGHSGVVAHYIHEYGSEAQRRRWLPKMATGEMIGAIAMTEPGSGSDLQGIRTRADRDGDQYVINGSKTFISNGLNCDLVVVVAKTDPLQGSRGVSLIVLETDNLPGFARGRNLEKIGMHGQDTVELFFDDVRCPVTNLLGAREGEGFVQLMQQLPRERLIIGVSAVAVMQAILEQTIAYAKERHAFGKALMEFQNTRFVLAECATKTHAATAFLDSCITRILDGQLDAPSAAMVKWWTSELQCEVVDQCLQLFGGYGFMREYPVSQAFVDARVQKIYGGTNEIMKEIIARSL